MKTLKNFSKGLAVASLVAGVSGAHASVISVGDSLNVSGTIASQDRGSDNIGYVSYGGGSAEHCYAGAFALTVVDTSQSQNNTYSIGSFCTDVSVNWQNSDTYKAVALNSATGVSPTWSDAPLSIQNAAWLYNTYFVGQSTTAAQDAGIQLAIWKVLYDTTGDKGLVSYSSLGSIFSTGNFKAWGFSGASLPDAESYIAALDLARTNGTFVASSDLWLQPNLSNPSQGLIYCPPPTGNTQTAPVPEPSTVLSGILLALPLGVSAFRILRRKKDAQNLI